MKCIQYGKEKLLEKTVKVPHASRKNHVLVKVVSAGLNPVDAKDVMGDKFPDDWKTVKGWLRRYISKCIIGFDFAGVVVEESCGFTINDQVFGTMPPMAGTLAEYISVPIDQISYMPKNYSFDQAAALPLVGLTALQALSPHVNEETSVLVLGGSGGTGHVSLQVAKCLGAKHITTVCGTKNADFCEQLGATEIVDYTKNQVFEELQASPAKPFGVVMDCVTSADPRDQAMDYPTKLRNQEGLLTDDFIYRRLGGASPDWIRAGLERTVGVNAWKDSHEKLFWIRFPKSSDELRQLQEFAQAEHLFPHVSETYGFTAEAVQQAFDAILSRRVKGKVVVRVGSPETNE